MNYFVEVNESIIFVSNKMECIQFSTNYVLSNKKCICFIGYTEKSKKNKFDVNRILYFVSCDNNVIPYINIKSIDCYIPKNHINKLVNI